MGYIPDNILVYIATSKAVEEQGVWQKNNEFCLEHR